MTILDDAPQSRPVPAENSWVNLGG